MTKEAAISSLRLANRWHSAGVGAMFGIMRIKTLLSTLGIVLAVIGLFFLAQGRGWVRWPADSFMIGSQQWITNGSIIAAVGLILVFVSRRMR